MNINPCKNCTESISGDCGQHKVNAFLSTNMPNTNQLHTTDGCEICEPKQTQEWEERFEKKFLTLANGVSSNDGKRYIDIIVNSKTQPATEEEIKSFIRSELSSAVAKAEQEMGKRITKEISELNLSDVPYDSMGKIFSIIRRYYE